MEKNEKLPDVGICEKCGRTFKMLPKDGVDRYLPPKMHKRYTDVGVICGGKVVPIEGEE